MCPLGGLIVCQAVIKIGAFQLKEPPQKPELYLSECFFTWDIDTDAFEVIDPPDESKMLLIHPFTNLDFEVKFEKVNCKEPVIMNFDCRLSKSCLRDYNNYYEIYIKDNLCKYSKFKTIKL